MIKHVPIFNTAKVEQMYTEKDGVSVHYVCTSALNTEANAMDIFYRETPHPEFGNRYFGLYIDHMNRVMITNADRIEEAQFSMIQDNNGDYHYSAHRHDCKIVEGKMIDGGRAYTRTDTKTYAFSVKDGRLTEIVNDR